MKKITILSLSIAVVLLVASCDGIRRKPGRVYMPDMAYSRAYETYSVTDSMKEALEKKMKELEEQKLELKKKTEQAEAKKKEDGKPVVITA